MLESRVLAHAEKSGLSRPDFLNSISRAKAGVTAQDSGWDRHSCLTDFDFAVTFPDP